MLSYPTEVERNIESMLHNEWYCWDMIESDRAYDHETKQLGEKHVWEEGWEESLLKNSYRCIGWCGSPITEEHPEEEKGEEMLSYHEVLADRAMLDTARLATDTICVACGEDCPKLSVVVHGIPVIVCNAACGANLVKYWAPAPLDHGISSLQYWFKRILGEY